MSENEQLNDRQLIFARALADGMTKIDAYRKAFDCKKLTDKTVATNACRLSKNAGVQRKLQELRERADSESIMTRREVMERLTEMAREAQAKGERRDAVACIQELNRMMGGYEPEKVKVEGELSVRKLLDNIAGAE